MKLTNKIVGQRKVCSRKRKQVEYRRTEGRPQNTRAPFGLQYHLWTIKMLADIVLLLLALALEPVNSSETPKPGMCAVCPEPRCATVVTGIWLKRNDKSIWQKGDEEIPECFLDNLKSDEPCQMPDGNLVLRTADDLDFEWKNLSSADGELISSVSKPCAELDLPSKPYTGTWHTSSTTPSAASLGTPLLVTRDHATAIAVPICLGLLILGGIVGGIIWKYMRADRDTSKSSQVL
ncbi:uncharacterized protein LOC135242193 [Anguilla rostrata]|uniref:uncharacterized protein LOC135242193 n=1 Tax=Anguilla rostrata TaxID=7938 RepID=UPI0030CB4EE5